MARSLGEAAAAGLEAGYRLVTDANERAYNRDRQQRLDSAEDEQRSYTRGRQERADQLGALDAQSRILANEGAGLAASNPDAATQQDFARRVQGLNSTRNDILGRVSGYDVAKVRQEGLDDIVKLQKGDVQDVNLTRATVVATGRPHTDYLRQDGQPSVVEQAGADLLKGMESGDQEALLRGVNVMYAPALQQGVGTKSPHGVIVGKQIIGLDHDTRSHPDDPHFVPRIRVYVNTGKPLVGPLPPGAPEGSTGYYDAPLTKNRSSDPNDPVRPVGIEEALSFLHLQQQYAEIMNTPEAQQKLQQEQQEGAFDPAEYLSALAQVGAAKTKPETHEYTVKKNEKHVIERRDPRTGAVLDTRTVEGEKGSGSTAADTMQAKLDAVDDDDSLSEREKAVERRAIRSGIKPGKYTGDKPSGGTAAAGSGTSSSLKERELKRKELKDLNESDSRDESNARSDLDKFEGRIKDASPSVRKSPETVAERQRLKDRLTTITNRIDARKVKIEAIPTGDDDEPAKPASTAAKPMRLKFDKDGKRVN